MPADFITISTIALFRFRSYPDPDPVMQILNILFLLLLSHSTLGGWEDSLYVDPNKLKFLRYTTAGDPHKYDDLRYMEPETITAFNRSLPTTLVVDGYTATFASWMNQAIKDSTLRYDEEPRNVLVFDFKNYSGVRFEDYPLVCQFNVPRAAQRAADMMAYLYGDEEPQAIHIIGHSLGVPLASAIGRIYKRKYGRTIARITGLDPARPYYDNFPHLQLRKGDADFVDIYHTERGYNGVLGGIKGDVNIYINGGGPQTFCPHPAQGGFCSHQFSWQFFQDTYQKVWTGCPCEGEACHCIENCDISCENGTRIGYYMPETARGDIHAQVIWPWIG